MVTSAVTRRATMLVVFVGLALCPLAVVGRSSAAATDGARADTSPTTDTAARATPNTAVVTLRGSGSGMVEAAVAALDPTLRSLAVRADRLVSLQPGLAMMVVKAEPAELERLRRP